MPSTTRPTGIAGAIHQLWQNNDCVATTWAGGYTVLRDGRKIYFEASAKTTDEKRDANGRCTKAKFHYSDGSVLLFRWSDHNGSSLQVDKGATPCKAN